jgi:hypothetical protein
MTEPLVIPAKPDVKPVPKREAPKPKPRRGDPWTVPGPKKKPTPKAIVIKKMTKKKNNKMIIDKKSTFLFLKKRMTKEDFYDKFELDPSLVSSLTAETGCTIIEKTDRALTAEELKSLEY